MATTQVNLRMDTDLLAKIDARCEVRGRKRTEWIEAALTFVLEQIETPTLTERAQLRTRIEPIAGNQNGMWAKEIAEREAGRAGRAQDYADKKELGLLGAGYVESKRQLAAGIDPLTGEVLDPDPA